MNKTFARILLVIGLSIIALVILLHSLGYTRPYSTGEYDDSPYKEWYKKIRQPKALYKPEEIARDPRIYPSYCCDVSDCHATEDEIRNDHYYARLGIRERNINEDLEWRLLDFVQVPDILVAHPEENPPNPTGHAVICHQVFELDEKGRYVVDDGEGGGDLIDYNTIPVFCFFPSSLL